MKTDPFPVFLLEGGARERAITIKRRKEKERKGEIKPSRFKRSSTRHIVPHLGFLSSSSFLLTIMLTQFARQAGSHSKSHFLLNRLGSRNAEEHLHHSSSSSTNLNCTSPHSTASEFTSASFSTATSALSIPTRSSTAVHHCSLTSSTTSCACSPSSSSLPFRLPSSLSFPLRSYSTVSPLQPPSRPLSSSSSSSCSSLSSSLSPSAHFFPLQLLP